jgi:hypothetical protein
MLEEAVDTRFQIISPEALVHDSLEAGVICLQIHVRADRIVIRATLIIRRIVVIEGRERQQRGGIEGVDPGEEQVAVGLALGIAQSVAGNRARRSQNLIAD